MADHDRGMICPANMGFHHQPQRPDDATATSEASTTLPCRAASGARGRLCRDVQRGSVHGLADVALVVLRDEEDFISRLRLGAHDVGQRRNGSVPVVECVDQVAGAGEDGVRHGLLEDIGRFYLSTYPLTAACSTTGSPQTDQWRGPPVFAAHKPRPGTNRNSATRSPMRPLVLSISAQQGSASLEHRDRHVDDRRPDLGSSRRPLKLIVRAEALELRRIVSCPGCPVQPHLVLENANADFPDDRHAHHSRQNHRHRPGRFEPDGTVALAATRGRGQRRTYGFSRSPYSASMCDRAHAPTTRVCELSDIHRPRHVGVAMAEEERDLVDAFAGQQGSACDRVAEAMHRRELTVLHRHRPPLIVLLMKHRERGVAALVFRLPLRRTKGSRHVALPKRTPGARAEDKVARLREARSDLVLREHEGQLSWDRHGARRSVRLPRMSLAVAIDSFGVRLPEVALSAERRSPGPLRAARPCSLSLRWLPGGFHCHRPATLPTTSAGKKAS